jgi:hypothetical protein
MRPVLSLDLACSGCNRSSLVLTLSLTMLISIEGMDDFCIEQLHPQGLCRLTLPSMARRLSRRYADGHRGIRNYGRLLFVFRRHHEIWWDDAREKMRWLNPDGGHGAHESHVQGLRRFVMWIIERRNRQSGRR